MVATEKALVKHHLSTPLCNSHPTLAHRHDPPAPSCPWPLFALGAAQLLVTYVRRARAVSLRNTTGNKKDPGPRPCLGAVRVWEGSEEEAVHGGMCSGLWQWRIHAPLPPQCVSLGPERPLSTLIRVCTFSAAEAPSLVCPVLCIHLSSPFYPGLHVLLQAAPSLFFVFKGHVRQKLKLKKKNLMFVCLLNKR